MRQPRLQRTGKRGSPAHTMWSREKEALQYAPPKRPSSQEQVQSSRRQAPLASAKNLSSPMKLAMQTVAVEAERMQGREKMG